METFQSVLSSLVGNFCDTPERFFTTNPKDAAVLLATTKKLYEFIKNTEQQCGKTFSSLPELYTEGLDLEQVWEELQLQNTPTLKYLNRRIQTLEEYVPSEEDASEEEEEEEEEEEDEEDESMQSSADDKDDGDVQFTGLPDSSDDDEDEQEGDHQEDRNATVSVLTEDQRKRILARKIAESAMEGEKEGENEDEDTHMTEGTTDPDSFFNMDDFEAFADGHEDMGGLMNVVVEEYDQLQELESEDDEDTEGGRGSGRKNKDDADMEEYRVDKEDTQESLDSLKEVSYQDFFDPVNQIKTIKKKNKKEDDDTNFDSSDSDSSSSEDEEEDKEGAGSSSSSSKSGGKKSSKRNRNTNPTEEGAEEEEHSEKSSSEEEEGSEGEEEEEGEEELSRHERYQMEMKLKIKEFEEENIQKRSWELMGEVGSGQRPKGSLMEAEMDYQRNTKTAPVITPDVTATLEDMIKERIKEELWDDVERRNVGDRTEDKAKELADVSTEKNKIGLGEIYAQEFEQRFLGAAASGEEETNKKEQELFMLWKKLSNQLDSLTNFHFTPKPKFDDMAVRTNVSAIQMEEVIPMGVSTDVAAAPEEIMRKKKGREGVLIGEEESTPEERQRARRAKKAARRKSRQAKLADEKAVARANPGLGNKYAMRKAMEGLERARNVTKADNVDAGVKWTKSSDVFKRLQEEVKSGLSSARGDGDGGSKKKKQKTGSGNGYKL